MMNKNSVYFTNPGHFDVAAMLTFGLSAKASDSAIGFFGTGFKYAVAIILRELGTIKITTKNDAGEIEIYSFISKRKTVRGSGFDVVYLIDHKDGSEREAGFTTRLGINWKPWMAFRELYCNAADEGGVTSTKYIEADTVIDVSCPSISEAMANKDQYILNGEPDFVHDAADIYDKPAEFIYYKGIAIASADTAMTYNIKGHIELTEDRTVKYDYYVKWAIQKAVQACDIPRLVRKAIAKGDNYEARMGFDKDWPVCDVFQDECRAMLKTQNGISEGARVFLKELVEASREFEEFELTAVQKKAYDKAVRFLSGIDVPVNQYPVKFVDGLGEGVMGRALDGVIYISPIALQMGVKQLASTLMEEWVHIKTGAKDFDRTMQNWLFDKILSIGESIAGEPL